MCLRKKAAWPVGLSGSQERAQPALQRSNEAGDGAPGAYLTFFRGLWESVDNFPQPCLSPEETHFFSPAHNSRLQHNTLVWALCVHLLSAPARTAPRLTTVAECTFIKTLPSFFKWFGRELEVYTFIDVNPLRFFICRMRSAHGAPQTSAARLNCWFQALGALCWSTILGYTPNLYLSLWSSFCPKAHSAPVTEFSHAVKLQSHESSGTAEDGPHCKWVLLRIRTSIWQEVAFS